LVHAIGSNLLGVNISIELAQISNHEIIQLEREMKEVDEATRRRLLRLFTLVELILDPMPEAATNTLKQVAESLRISDEFIDIVREYSQRAYGIAAKDLERKGYLGDPTIVRMGYKNMRINKELTDPFDADKDDQRMLRQWQDLEIVIKTHLVEIFGNTIKAEDSLLQGKKAVLIQLLHNTIGFIF
jgi:hypothetical protein